VLAVVLALLVLGTYRPLMERLRELIARRFFGAV
jgi:hypothetical protein